MVEIDDNVRSAGTIGGWRRELRRGRVHRVNRVTVDVMVEHWDGGFYGPYRFRKERVRKT